MTPVKPSSENPIERAWDRTRVTCMVSEHANHYTTEDTVILLVLGLIGMELIQITKLPEKEHKHHVVSRRRHLIRPSVTRQTVTGALPFGEVRT